MTRWTVRVEASSIRQIKVLPAVIVVIEESDAAALGFNDGPLVFGAAPNIGDCQTGLAGYVDKHNRRGSGGTRASSRCQQGPPPPPERRCKRIEHRAAENHKSRSENTPSRNAHALAPWRLRKTARAK